MYNINMHLNGGLVNVDASHYFGSMFSSTVDPRCVNPAALSEPASNVQAASASALKGGRRKKHTINRKKINKISRKYKMKGTKRHIRSKVRRMKSRIRRRYSKRRRSARRVQKGGAQYQNNVPLTQTYSTGGILSPSLSALASPVPYQVLSNCTNCIDNYSKFTNAGFPSKN
jgi:hypothetical protein